MSDTPGDEDEDVASEETEQQRVAREERERKASDAADAAVMPSESVDHSPPGSAAAPAGAGLGPVGALVEQPDFTTAKEWFNVDQGFPPQPTPEHATSTLRPQGSQDSLQDQQKQLRHNKGFMYERRFHRPAASLMDADAAPLASGIPAPIIANTSVRALPSAAPSSSSSSTAGAALLSMPTPDIDQARYMDEAWAWDVHRHPDYHGVEAAAQSPSAITSVPARNAPIVSNDQTGGATPVQPTIVSAIVSVPASRAPSIASAPTTCRWATPTTTEEVKEEKKQNSRTGGSNVRCHLAGEGPHAVISEHSDLTHSNVWNSIQHLKCLDLPDVKHTVATVTPDFLQLPYPQWILEIMTCFVQDKTLKKMKLSLRAIIKHMSPYAVLVMASERGRNVFWIDHKRFKRIGPREWRLQFLWRIEPKDHSRGRTLLISIRKPWNDHVGLLAVNNKAVVILRQRHRERAMTAWDRGTFRVSAYCLNPSREASSSSSSAQRNGQAVPPSRGTSSHAQKLPSGTQQAFGVLVSSDAQGSAPWHFTPTQPQLQVLPYTPPQQQQGSIQPQQVLHYTPPQQQQVSIQPQQQQVSIPPQQQVSHYIQIQQQGPASSSVARLQQRGSDPRQRQRLRSIAYKQLAQPRSAPSEDEVNGLWWVAWDQIRQAVIREDVVRKHNDGCLWRDSSLDLLKKAWNEQQIVWSSDLPGDRVRRAHTSTLSGLYQAAARGRNCSCGAFRMLDELINGTVSNKDGRCMERVSWCYDCRAFGSFRQMWEQLVGGVSYMHIPLLLDVPCGINISPMVVPTGITTFPHLFGFYPASAQDAAMYVFTHCFLGVQVRHADGRLVFHRRDTHLLDFVPLLGTSIGDLQWEYTGGGHVVASVWVEFVRGLFGDLVGAYRLPVERRTRPVRPNTVSINVGLDCPPLGHPGKHDFEFQRIRPLTPQINWSVTNHIPAHPDQVDATGSFVLGTMHTEQKPEPSDVLYSLGCRGLLWHVLGFLRGPNTDSDSQGDSSSSGQGDSRGNKRPNSDNQGSGSSSSSSSSNNEHNKRHKGNSAGSTYSHAIDVLKQSGDRLQHFMPTWGPYSVLVRREMQKDQPDKSEIAKLCVLHVGDYIYRLVYGDLPWECRPGNTLLSGLVVDFDYDAGDLAFIRAMAIALTVRRQRDEAHTTFVEELQPGTVEESPVDDEAPLDPLPKLFAWRMVSLWSLAALVPIIAVLVAVRGYQGNCSQKAHPALCVVRSVAGFATAALLAVQLLAHAIGSHCRHFLKFWMAITVVGVAYTGVEIATMGGSVPPGTGQPSPPPDRHGCVLVPNTTFGGVCTISGYRKVPPKWRDYLHADDGSPIGSECSAQNTDPVFVQGVIGDYLPANLASLAVEALVGRHKFSKECRDVLALQFCDMLVPPCDANCQSLPPCTRNCHKIKDLCRRDNSSSSFNEMVDSWLLDVANGKVPTDKLLGPQGVGAVSMLAYSIRYCDGIPWHHEPYQCVDRSLSPDRTLIAGAVNFPQLDPLGRVVPPNATQRLAALTWDPARNCSRPAPLGYGLCGMTRPPPPPALLAKHVEQYSFMACFGLVSVLCIYYAWFNRREFGPQRRAQLAREQKKEAYDKPSTGTLAMFVFNVLIKGLLFAVGVVIEDPLTAAITFSAAWLVTLFSLTMAGLRVRPERYDATHPLAMPLLPLSGDARNGRPYLVASFLAFGGSYYPLKVVVLEVMEVGIQVYNLSTLDPSTDYTWVEILVVLLGVNLMSYILLASPVQQLCTACDKGVMWMVADTIGDTVFFAYNLARVFVFVPGTGVSSALPVIIPGVLLVHKIDCAREYARRKLKANDSVTGNVFSFIHHRIRTAFMVLTFIGGLALIVVTFVRVAGQASICEDAVSKVVWDHAYPHAYFANGFWSATTCGFQYVTTLDISGQGLSTVSEGINHLTSLKSLSLGNNVLTALPLALSSMTSLRELAVNHNRLSSLAATPDDLGVLTQLEVLDVSSNDLHFIHPSVFVPKPPNKQVHVVGNPFAEVVPWGAVNLTSISPIVVQSLATTARKLHFADNRLREMPLAQLSEFAVVEHIDLSRNMELTEWPANVVINLRSSRLKLLNLSHGVLGAVPGGLPIYGWPSAPTLTVDLSYARLSGLHVNIMSFPGRLILHGNPNVTELVSTITTLKYGLNPAVGDLTNLRTLYFRDSGLTTLPASLAKTKVSSVTLIRLPMRTVPPVLGHMSHLQELRIDHSNLRSLPADVVANWTRLTSLIISHSYVSAVPATISRLTSLFYLSLSNNELVLDAQGRLGPGVDLAPLQALRYLKLGDNRLTGVPAGVRHLKLLWQLLLQQNHITELPDDMGLVLPHLTRLLLYGNKLQRLPPSLLSNFTSLDSLRVDDNQLVHFPWATLCSTFSSFKTLSMACNPITSVDPCVAYIQGLDQLDVSDTSLSSLPSDICKLSGGGTELKVCGCPYNTTVPACVASQAGACSHRPKFCK